MIFVFVWLTSLSMKISRFTHVAENGIISFFFMAEEYFIVYMYHIFLTHSSVDGHLGSSQVLAIVNSAAINIGVHVFFTNCGFLWIDVRSGIELSLESNVELSWHGRIYKNEVHHAKLQRQETRNYIASWGHQEILTS